MVATPKKLKAVEVEASQLSRQVLLPFLGDAGAQKFDAFLRQGYVDSNTLTSVEEWLKWKATQKGKGSYLLAKRLFDIVLGSILLAIASPVFLLVFILSKLRSNEKVIFTQYRIGYFGEPFIIYKFRTLSPPPHGVDLHSSLAKPLEKSTFPVVFSALGEFLRSHKIDELPQLVNVIRGEMSLVGPRPLEIADIVTFSKKYYTRFSMKPGITGLWQATRPNTLPASRKLRFDCWYVKKSGFLLDLKLLLMT